MIGSRGLDLFSELVTALCCAVLFFTALCCATQFVTVWGAALRCAMLLALAFRLNTGEIGHLFSTVTIQGQAQLKRSKARIDRPRY